MGLRQPHTECSPHQEYTLEAYAGEEYTLPVSTPGCGSGELVIILIICLRDVTSLPRQLELVPSEPGVAFFFDEPVEG
jgi:hypothetical protein